MQLSIFPQIYWSCVQYVTYVSYSSGQAFHMWFLLCFRPPRVKAIIAQQAVKKKKKLLKLQYVSCKASLRGRERAQCRAVHTRDVNVCLGVFDPSCHVQPHYPRYNYRGSQLLLIAFPQSFNSDFNGKKRRAHEMKTELTRQSTVKNFLGRSDLK